MSRAARRTYASLLAALLPRCAAAQLQADIPAAGSGVNAVPQFASPLALGAPNAATPSMPLAAVPIAAIAPLDPAAGLPPAPPESAGAVAPERIPGAFGAVRGVSAALGREAADPRGVLDDAYAGSSQGREIQPIRPLPRAKPAPFGKSGLSGRAQAVSLFSPAGQRRLAQAGLTPYLDKSIIDSYEPQRHETFCGVASGCIVIKALKPGGSQGEVTQENFLAGNDDIKPARVIMDYGTPTDGLTLEQLSRMLGRHDMKAEAVYAEASLDEGTSRLREAVKDVLSRKGDRKMIVNFHGKALGSGSSGHFSPIAAYHEQSDAVLILDTAAHKNRPFWIPIRDLYYAMRAADASAGRPRGYLVVRKAPREPVRGREP